MEICKLNFRDCNINYKLTNPNLIKTGGLGCLSPVKPQKKKKKVTIIMAITRDVLKLKVSFYYYKTETVVWKVFIKLCVSQL